MYWLPPDPPACAAQMAAFPALFRRALETPELGFTCASLLRNGEQRDRILRQAYTAAMLRRDKDVARRYFTLVQDRGWIGDVNFFDAAQLAHALPAAQSGRLLLAAALKNPSLAVREVSGYWDAAGGVEAFERAVLLAPDEAVTIARANSPTGAAVRAAMAASSNAGVRRLKAISEREGIGDLTRQRLAVLFREPGASHVDDDASYFARLVDLRLNRVGDEARLYDRALESFSQMLFVEARRGVSALDRMQPDRMSARAAYLLLSYGRTEADDPTFEAIFDRLLAPRLRAGAMAELLEETRGVNLRQFLSTAITHNRFEKLLSLAGSESAQLALLERAVTGLHQAERPLEEAVAAAEVIDNTTSGVRLRKLAEAVQREYQRGGTTAGLYGLLAARLAQRGQPSDLGRRFERYLQPPSEFDVAPLFRDDNTCIQRHFFYDDDDGVESFASFRQTFGRDAAWEWEANDGWVRVTGKGAHGRRIVMLANEPLDLMTPSNAGRQDEAARRQSAVARYMADHSLAPAVVVHRGHAYHVEKTMRSLTDSARLVFLGSCRGTADIDAVMAAASSAQVIATRSVGTQGVNDPLLKAINGELLRGEAKLDWAALWAEQQRKLASNGLFRDYIPPHRNSAAILLAAYHNYLSDGRP
ncbi:MAG: hypothetical protein SFV51_29040 [Bryobacteraceae bacterium]|nr:hypothetical protein [Bryobacteraceae bacterium]